MTSPTLIFDHATQELTYHTVKDYLQSSPLFQCSLQIEPHRPQFHVIYGSAQVDIEVTNWGFHPWNTDQDMAIVTASSCITRGSIFNTDLAQYLLRENRRMRFGGFQLDEASNIWFSHSILGGEHMDLMKLRSVGFNL